MNLFILNNKKAFTLLEILLVIAIIGILAAIVIIAINPSHQLASTRNTQRYSDINSIYMATNQYLIDNKGKWPETINTTPLEICQTGAINCNGMADLSFLTNNSTYLTSLPVDPSTTSTIGTGYFAYKTPANRLVVIASLAEIEKSISIGTSSPSVTPIIIYNPSIINRWAFDDSSGCILTDVISGNTGTLAPACPSNSPVWTTGKTNSALFFDGIDDYITVADSANLNPSTGLTLSAWIKWSINPTTGLSWASIINKGVDNQYRLQHNVGNTAFEFAIRTGAGNKWVQSNTIPVQNVWYYVVGTYDGSSLKIYVDGVLEKSTIFSGNIIGSNYPLDIGRRAITNDRYFNGTIDEVNIYSSALTAEEIQNIYIAGK